MKAKEIVYTLGPQLQASNCKLHDSVQGRRIDTVLFFFDGFGTKLSKFYSFQ